MKVPYPYSDAVFTLIDIEKGLIIWQAMDTTNGYAGSLSGVSLMTHSADSVIVGLYSQSQSKAMIISIDSSEQGETTFLSQKAIVWSGTKAPLSLVEGKSPSFYNFRCFFLVLRKHLRAKRSGMEYHVPQ